MLLAKPLFSDSFLKFLKITLQWNDVPFKEIADLVKSIRTKDFMNLIRFVIQIANSGDLETSYKMLDNLETAFNFAKCFTPDSLEKRKMEDLQHDLINLKRDSDFRGESRPDPSMHVLLDTICKKLESNRQTHEFIKALRAARLQCDSSS